MDWKENCLHKVGFLPAYYKMGKNEFYKGLGDTQKLRKLLEIASSQRKKALLLQQSQACSPLTPLLTGPSSDQVGPLLLHICKRCKEKETEWGKPCILKPLMLDSMQ